jgi:ABC-type antimicrobial peptide transport system permease subunit
MSIIPIQKFHLTLTDSQTIQETLNYGNTTVMNIFSKQRNFINRKAIFFFATQNKNETVALSAKDKISKGHNNNELSRTDNIANNASNVNNTGTKFSLDVDSDGNKLTQQQAEYFENSKVRDDDGNLLKVYHGTSKSFTAFS